MATVRIGSQQVDVNHVLETSAWYLLISASLALFAVLMARFRRLTNAHRVPNPIRVRMLHVVGLQCSLTLGSLDPNHIFFVWTRFIGMIAFGALGGAHSAQHFTVLCVFAPTPMF